MKKRWSLKRNWMVLLLILLPRIPKCLINLIERCLFKRTRHLKPQHQTNLLYLMILRISETILMNGRALKNHQALSKIIAQWMSHFNWLHNSMNQNSKLRFIITTSIIKCLMRAQKEAQAIMMNIKHRHDTILSIERLRKKKRSVLSPQIMNKQTKLSHNLKSKPVISKVILK